MTLLALSVGHRYALVSLLTLVVIVLCDGVYVCFVRDNPLPAGLAQDQAILDPNQFSNWIRVTAVFAAVGVAIIGAVGFLVQRLEEAVHHNGTLFGSLQRASSEKIRALEEREVLREKVKRAGELQLLGLLSATVAHDFNNLLMVILGSASLLKQDVQGQAKEDVADIERAGEQAADLCRRLLTLAGERISVDEIMDLNELIEGELPLLRRLVTAKVDVEWEPGPPLWLKCARTEMRQALLNLCANARDALPQGGHLRISTAEVQRRLPGRENVATLASLVISDDGIGMDAETRTRLFEPFFTTKGKGRGTGLGMAVVSAAVERHAGFLELESEPGKGTTFSLFFPLAEEPADETSKLATSSPPMSHGRETVLVVDDDEGARKMLTRYLQKHGYTLLTASDGQEALDVLRRTEKVDLIVSDSVMAHLSGRELLDAVSKDRPDMPFLFCSGFPARTISPDVLESPHRALLVKPFSEQALLEKVRQLLDSARPIASS